MLVTIAEMWIVALVVASMLFVGVVTAQAVTRQVRALRGRDGRPTRELTRTA